MTRWGGVMRPKPTNYITNLGSGISRRSQYWMDPAVVVVCIKSRAYRIMHMATVIQAWHSWHDPDIRRWSKYIGNFNPIENSAAERAEGETQKHHQTLLTGRKHPNAARWIELEAEAASLPLRGPSSAILRLSMSATGAPVSLTLGRQPTTSCYIIRLLPTADDPVLEALQLQLPHSSTDL